MFPHHGEGFIWDTVSIKDDIAETTIFVPESRKLFIVSIPINDIHKKHLLPIEWIKWSGVGVRDASRPIKLIGATLIGKKEDSPIRPEFSNQTTFESVLLFPESPDLIEFVGKNNAWSPFVGIVNCDEDCEITRGAYCTGYIERDYDKTESTFRVNVGKLKFPEGYKSEEHKKIFEGLTREVTIAAEEARVLASKGRTGYDYQVMPLNTKSQYNAHGGPNKFNNTKRFVQRNAGPRAAYKSKEEIAHHNTMRSFAKSERLHYSVVYKKKGLQRFVGWTSKLGSIPIYTNRIRIGNQIINVEDTILSRIEYNERTGELAVETVEEIEKTPFINFKVRKGEELLLKFQKLDLSQFKPMKELWKGRRVGVIEHEMLLKILVDEELVLKEEWRDKMVTATLLHYEGIENDTPAKIRLILESIDGLIEEEQSQDAMNADSNLRSIDSRSVDNDNNEYRGGGEEDDDEEPKRMSASSAVHSIDNHNNECNSMNNHNGRGNMKDNGRNGKGYGNQSSRGGERGQSSSRGGRVVDERNSHNTPISEPFLHESHGFGNVHLQKGINRIEKGIIVCFSTKESIIYTDSHRLVQFDGNIRLHKLNLGEYAEFEMIESSTSRLPWRVVLGTLHKIYPLHTFHTIVINDELFIRVLAFLTPHREIFECEHVSDIRLNPNQMSLKLSDGKFIEKSRVKIGDKYRIFIKFNSDDLEWKFESIDPSGDFDAEDDIDRMKRMNKEKEKNGSCYSNISGYDSRNKNDMRSEQESTQRSSSSLYRDNQYSQYTNRHQDSVLSAPSQMPSTTPSIVSCSTQMTTTTDNCDKSVKALRKDLSSLQKMLKSVWGYKGVQKIVKEDNFFLYETVDDWIRELAEDESEALQ